MKGGERSVSMTECVQLLKEMGQMPGAGYFMRIMPEMAPLKKAISQQV